MRVKYNADHGIAGFAGLNTILVEPHQIVSVAQHILPDDSPITAYQYTPDVFSFEVISPDSTPQGRLGDPTITPENFTAFTGWYKPTYPNASLPNDAAKVAKHYRDSKAASRPAPAAPQPIPDNPQKRTDVELI
jgi:hypothetical protein